MADKIPLTPWLAREIFRNYYRIKQDSKKMLVINEDILYVGNLLPEHFWHVP